MSRCRLHVPNFRTNRLPGTWNKKKLDSLVEIKSGHECMTQGELRAADPHKALSASRVPHING